MVDSYLNYTLKAIQRQIKPFDYVKVNLNSMSKSVLKDYNNNLSCFVMDSFTRCLNIKKCSEDKYQETTHCSVYFKMEKLDNQSHSASNGIERKVYTIFVSSNKNSNVLLKRIKNLFNLIGYETIENSNFELSAKKIENFNRTTVTNEFLNCLDFKFSNLFESLEYLKKSTTGNSVDIKKDEFKSSGEKVFKNWCECLGSINANKINWHEKLRNAFQDASLFYFYLSIFYNFMNEYFNLDKTQLFIINTDKTPLYGLHCEAQLVLKYLNEIDKNNDYISLSGDCCVLCHLLLKNLDLSHYGHKNNICSSRFWKFRCFDSEVLKIIDKNRIVKFYQNMGSDLSNIDKMLIRKEFTLEKKCFEGELPYSDEWIDGQYSIWRRLLSHQHQIIVDEIKKLIGSTHKNDKKMFIIELNKVLSSYASYFSENMLNHMFNDNVKKLLEKKFDQNEIYEIKEELYKLIENSIFYAINTNIEYYYYSMQSSDWVLNVKSI